MTCGCCVKRRRLVVLRTYITYAKGKQLRLFSVPQSDVSLHLQPLVSTAIILSSIPRFSSRKHTYTSIRTDTFPRLAKVSFDLHCKRLTAEFHHLNSDETLYLLPAKHFYDVLRRPTCVCLSGKDGILLLPLLDRINIPIPQLPSTALLPISTVGTL